MLKKKMMFAVLSAAVFSIVIFSGCGSQANRETVPVTSPQAVSALAEPEILGAPPREAAQTGKGKAGAGTGTESQAAAGTEDHSNTESVSDMVNGSVASGAENASASNAATGRKLTPLEHYYQGGDFWDGCPERNVQLLTPNEYSRPQIPIEEVRDIVIHFVDEPGSTAMQNRDYFESLKDGSGRSVSSHFVIGLDGEIVQCVPLDEVSYASNHRNKDSISIENCHPDSTGKFTDETYISCVNLTAWLCYAFEITPDHVIRHYDITEKDCPRYFVQHEDAWLQFKEEVAERYYELEKTYGKRRTDE